MSEPMVPKGTKVHSPGLGSQPAEELTELQELQARVDVLEGTVESILEALSKLS